MKLNKVVFKFVSISFSILVALLVVVGLVELGSYCYDFGYRVFTEAPVDAAPGRDVVVSVTSDMSEHDIGEMLKDEGLVRDANLFFAQLKLSAYSGKLKPGVYTLNTSMATRDMLVVMAAETEEGTEEETEQSGADAGTVPDDSAGAVTDDSDGTADDAGAVTDDDGTVTDDGAGMEAAP